MLSTKSGFTIFELVIVIGIIAVISLFTISFAPKTINRVELYTTTKEVVQAIKSSQNNSRNNFQNQNNGIYFTNQNYTIFSGNSYNPLNETNQTTELPNGVSISNIQLGGSNTTIIFEKFTGQPDTTGTITIGNANNYTTISLDNNGLITVNYQ